MDEEDEEEEGEIEDAPPPSRFASEFRPRRMCGLFGR